jgi:hypothetical protein
MLLVCLAAAKLLVAVVTVDCPSSWPVNGALWGCPGTLRDRWSRACQQCVTALTEKRAAIGLRVTLNDPERVGSTVRQRCVVSQPHRGAVVSLGVSLSVLGCVD